MQAWKTYQEKNKERFLEELFGLLRIPSVSSDSTHKPDMLDMCRGCKKIPSRMRALKRLKSIQLPDIRLCMRKKSWILPNPPSWCMDITTYNRWIL